MSKNKKAYKGGHCACGMDDLFFEHQLMAQIMEYMRFNHVCSTCAQDALRKRSEQIREGREDESL